MTTKANEVQGIYSISHVVKGDEEKWITIHHEILDKESGQKITASSYNPPESIGVLWNSLVTDFVEIYGADPLMWREFELTKICYPIDSKDGTKVRMCGVNPSAYGVMPANFTAMWSAVPIGTRSKLEALETAVILWLERRIAEKNNAPVQLNLLTAGERMQQTMDEQETADTVGMSVKWEQVDLEIAAVNEDVPVKKGKTRGAESSRRLKAVK